MITELLNDGDCCIILMTIKLMKKTLRQKLSCHFSDGFVSLFVTWSNLFTDCCLLDHVFMFFTNHFNLCYGFCLPGSMDVWDLCCITSLCSSMNKNCGSLHIVHILTKFCTGSLYSIVRSSMRGEKSS